LSLRHGWGCAANPEKAVEWLHSAAETASAQVNENGIRRPGGGGAYDLNFRSEEGKRGGATLALAIYELGQSYMQGWGVAKDKHLALRCYEISANFGDTDGQWYVSPPLMPLRECMLIVVVKLRGVIYTVSGPRRTRKWPHGIIEWQRNRV
jgi:TPR repeat protein